jgi:hypothetical protein
VSLLGKLKQTLRLRATLEDHLLTRPSPFFVPGFDLDEHEEQTAQQAVRAIHESGAFMAGIRVTASQASNIRRALTEAFEGRRPDVQSSVNARTGIAHIHNPLRLCEEILAIATDRFLCGIVERYLRRRIILADVDLRRVPPMDMAEVDVLAGTQAVGYTSSHWHRDVRGRQVKIMIYLTDVTETDSNFAFLPGTHVGHHIRPRRFETSRFSNTWVEQCGITPVECYGPAGTTMVFDTNFIHRLRRKPTATVRDSVTFYYTVGQESRPLDVEPERAAHLSGATRALLGGYRPAASPQAE